MSSSASTSSVQVDRSGGAREEGWSEGVQQAEEAEELTCEERLALLMPGSQGEDEEEGEEGDDEGSQEEEEKKRRPKSRSREAEEPARKRRRIVMPDSSDSESEQVPLLGSSCPHFRILLN